MVDGLFAPASVYAAWAAGWRLLGRSPPPFYGRALFAVSTVVACVSHSATIDVMGLFLGSFREEGVSLGVLSSLLAVGTLANGALQPVSGRLIDKLGARVVTCWALAVLASGLLVLSISRGAAALALGFVLVRCGGISGCSA